MPFALEIALDAESAAVVRTAWRALAAAGFSFMAESGANPHVSLAIWDEIDVAAMSAAVTTFGRETREIPIVFDRIDIFATTGVVFLAPVPDRALHEMQVRCHRHLDGHGHRPWPHYAVEFGGIPMPVVGRLSRAELVRFRPVHYLTAVPLTPSR